MAIRVNLPKTAKTPVKFEPAFSGDRAAALARAAKPVAKEPAAPGAPAGPAGEPAAPVEGIAAPAIKVAPPAARVSISLPRPVTTAAAKAGTPGAAPAPGTAPGADPAAPGADEGAPVSEALLDPTSAPAKIRAFSVVLKWSAIAATMLAVGFVAMRFLVPFLQEVKNPTKSAATVATKDAPMAVRMVRETRNVVAKSDANVAYLNQIVAVAENKKPEAGPAPAAPAAPEIRRAPPALVAGKTDLSPFQDAIARLKLSGVFDGPDPRVYLNGRIVKYGEIIDRDLALRFMGVDPVTKSVLFTNADNVVFRKYY